MAKAIDNGRAIIATIIPATISLPICSFVSSFSFFILNNFGNTQTLPSKTIIAKFTILVLFFDKI